MGSILPLQVKLMLALREHRMHHLIWHSVRDNWERIEDESLKDGIRARVGSLSGLQLTKIEIE